MSKGKNLSTPSCFRKKMEITLGFSFFLPTDLLLFIPSEDIRFDWESANSLAVAKVSGELGIASVDMRVTFGGSVGVKIKMNKTVRKPQYAS